MVGYLRETAFLVINSVLHNYPFPYNRSYVTPPKFLYTYSDDTLLTIKWVLTFLFSVIFFGFAILLFNFYFKNKSFNKITFRIYFSLLVSSFILSMVGILSNSFDETYSISRFIIGLAQSPLIPLVLFVLFYFKNKPSQIPKP